MEKLNSRLDPLTVLRDTATRFRRKVEVYRQNILNIGEDDPYAHHVRLAIYQHEAERLDDLIALCDGTATVNASADTLPVTAETGDDNEQT